MSRGHNHDLYDIIFDSVDKTNVKLEVKWMPSHLDTEPDKARPNWVQDKHIAGNCRADELATDAAKICQLDTNAVTKVIKYTHLAKKIQLRLATIICNLQYRRKVQDDKSIKVPKPTIEQMLTVSKHFVNLDRGQYRCALCKASVGAKDPTLPDFLLADCLHTKAGNINQPSRIRIPMRIGKGVTHVTHNLYNYKGIIYCQTCGYTASQKLRGLALECTRVRTAHGKIVIDRISKDKFPPGVDRWPDDAHGVSTNSSSTPLHKQKLEQSRESPTKLKTWH